MRTATARSSFVDNTFATPYNTNPLDLGADVVIHSLTKYIGGHGDLLGGAVISNDEQFLRQCRLGTLMHFGAVIAPFTAFLVCRGMKTLGVRMRQYNESALKIARWLESDPGSRRCATPCSSQTRSMRSPAARCAGAAA